MIINLASCRGITRKRLAVSTAFVLCHVLVLGDEVLLRTPRCPLAEISAFAAEALQEPSLTGRSLLDHQKRLGHAYGELPTSAGSTVKEANSSPEAFKCLLRMIRDQFPRPQHESKTGLALVNPTSEGVLRLLRLNLSGFEVTVSDLVGANRRLTAGGAAKVLNDLRKRDFLRTRKVVQGGTNCLAYRLAEPPGNAAHEWALDQLSLLTPGQQISLGRLAQLAAKHIDHSELPLEPETIVAVRTILSRSGVSQEPGQNELADKTNSDEEEKSEGQASNQEPSLITWGQLLDLVEKAIRSSQNEESLIDRLLSLEELRAHPKLKDSGFTGDQSGASALDVILKALFLFRAGQTEQAQAEAAKTAPFKAFSLGPIVRDWLRRVSNAKPCNPVYPKFKPRRILRGAA